MRIRKTRQITLAASMAALSIILDVLSIHNDTSKFTLYGFPLLLTGILFGPVIGGLAGLVVGFIAQLISPYGLGLTTPLWMLAPIAWGLVSGLIAKLFKSRTSIKAVVITVIATSLSCTALNTLALYLDGIINMYPTPLLIAQLGGRIAVSLVLSVPYTFGIYAILSRLAASPLLSSSKT